jgi:hypothetical protein
VRVVEAADSKPVSAVPVSESQFFVFARGQFVTRRQFDSYGVTFEMCDFGVGVCICKIAKDIRGNVVVSGVRKLLKKKGPILILRREFVIS